MALQAAQTVSAGALSTPAALTPSASETIAASSFGVNGVLMRIITTGTATNVVVLDPGFSPSGNAGSPPTLAAPATGVRETLIPRSAVNPATGVATVTFSGALTGVTYELKRV
jgi:hypothetical protein